MKRRRNGGETEEKRRDSGEEYGNQTVFRVFKALDGGFVVLGASVGLRKGECERRASIGEICGFV